MMPEPDSSRQYPPVTGRLLAHWRLALLIAGIVFLCVLPLTAHGYYLGVLTSAFLFAVFAMSWDLMFGYSGEVNFGPTMLVGVGAYTAAMLNVYAGVGMWLCIACGAVAATLAGLLLVAPALRLRGAYFGIITLVAAIILEKVIEVLAGVTGGEIGLGVQSILAVSVLGNYYIAFAFMVVSGVVLVLVSHSTIGLILEASGQDPVATRALGLNIIKYKVVAFAVSAFLSGMAGAMTVFYLGTASVSTVVAIAVTLQIIVSAVVGGRRTIIGPAIGAIVIILATEWLRPIGQLNNVVVDIMALIVLLVFPNGLIGIFGRRRKLS